MDNYFARILIILLLFTYDVSSIIQNFKIQKKMKVKKKIRYSNFKIRYFQNIKSATYLLQTLPNKTPSVIFIRYFEHWGNRIHFPAFKIPVVRWTQNKQKRGHVLIGKSRILLRFCFFVH